MKLITYCKSCKKSTPIESKGILLRTDLEDNYGNAVSYQCKHCLVHLKTHPNQVYAINSKLPMLITSIIGLSIIGFAYAIWEFQGWTTIILLSLAGVIMSAGFFSANGSNAKAFNKSFVRS